MLVAAWAELRAATVALVQAAAMLAVAAVRATVSTEVQEALVEVRGHYCHRWKEGTMGVVAEAKPLEPRGSWTY